MAIFVGKGHSKLSQTIGCAFIRRVCLLRRIRYVLIELLTLTDYYSITDIGSYFFPM